MQKIFIISAMAGMLLLQSEGLARKEILPQKTTLDEPALDRQYVSRKAFGINANTKQAIKEAKCQAEKEARRQAKREAQQRAQRRIDINEEIDPYFWEALSEKKQQYLKKNLQEDNMQKNNSPKDIENAILEHDFIVLNIKGDMENQQQNNSMNGLLNPDGSLNPNTVLAFDPADFIITYDGQNQQQNNSMNGLLNPDGFLNPNTVLPINSANFNNNDGQNQQQNNSMNGLLNPDGSLNPNHLDFLSMGVRLDRNTGKYYPKY